MSQSSESDGWDDNQLIIQQIKQKRQFRFSGQKAINLLQDNQHSLQPDMVLGWRPRLPSCPVPLSYGNSYTQQIKSYLLKQKTYNVVYIGNRPSNSVQVNQKHNYFWKYRNKYIININIIKQAVIKVGACKQQNPSLVLNQHLFDSNFQSGNLDLAVKIRRNEYDCFIRSDTNTRGHTNWFYFKITNNKQIGPVRINICNFTKPKSLYSEGMRPYCKNNEDQKWSQSHCYDIVFGQKLCRYGTSLKTYCLQFTYNFKKVGQQAYFAYSIPYTYSDLQNFIAYLKKQDFKHLRITSLCQSLGGISLPLFIISNQFSQQYKKNHNKKVVIITARIHPGESNSSYLVQGFVRGVLKRPQLLSHYKFYIVPMLNPDGVIIGNFRTSYSGKDLNRQFNKLNKYIFPQIYGLKQLVDKIKDSWQNTLQFFFDFHGHSLKKNLFCYGPQHKVKSAYYMQAKAFTKIIQRQNKIFDYKSSLFIVSQAKRDTARAFMLEKQKVPFSFTFQISNGLFVNSSNSIQFLNKQIIIQAGQSISSSLLQYSAIFSKLTKKHIIAKIDSGKYQRKIGSCNSSIKKIKSIQIQERFSQSFNKTLQLNLSFDDIIKQIQTQNTQKQIKKKQECRPDDQGSEQDLTQQESQDLFAHLIKRKTIQNYKQINLKQKQITKVNVLQLPKFNQQSKEIQQNLKPKKKNQFLNFRKAYPNLFKNNKQTELTTKVAIPSRHYTFLI